MEQNICQQHSKTDIIVGFEPTGRHWFTLDDYLKSQGHKLTMVNKFQVKRTKKLDDFSPTKSDRKDPKTIAMLVKDGRYRKVYIPEDVYQELREAVSERDRLVRRKSAISNRITRWLYIHFSEFHTIFKDWHRKAAMQILQNYPTPDKIVAVGAVKIGETWKLTMKRTAGLKRAEELSKQPGKTPAERPVL